MLLKLLLEHNRVQFIIQLFDISFDVLHQNIVKESIKGFILILFVFLFAAGTLGPALVQCLPAILGHGWRIGINHNLFRVGKLRYWRRRNCYVLSRTLRLTQHRVLLDLDSLYLWLFQIGEDGNALGLLLELIV